MSMTVGELKEALDDFGDHLPVVLVVEGEYDTTYTAFEVDVRTLGESSVTLTAEQGTGKRTL